MSSRNTSAASRITKRWMQTVVGTPAIARPLKCSVTARGDATETTLCTEELARRISPDLRVLRGPFLGLRYPGARAFGSALLPKLVGSYELEIQPIVEGMCGATYESIIDIGCAEGYYAVGLARRVEQSKVFAVDLNQAALDLCRLMADHNGVGDRVVTVHGLPKNWIDQYVIGRRALIISDCEGFEYDCFGGQAAEELNEADLLIETHDFLRPGTTAALIQRFENTHWISEVRSIHDHVRAVSFGMPELLQFDLDTRLRIVGEGRPRTMSWLVLNSKRRGPRMVGSRTSG